MVNLILECVAVLMAILYLVLAAKEDVKCWYAALISSLFYIYIMFQAGLVMESILQIFYVLMAIYGYLQWNNMISVDSDLSIKSWNKINHLYSIGLVILLSTFSGILLERYTQAVLPFLDAFTTFGAIITTYMVAKKIIENWIYWFVIDSISIYLFLSRELYLTALLFFIYLVIIIFGYISWKKKLEQ
jgi:nicotinamide mononucleotide transporter